MSHLNVAKHMSTKTNNNQKPKQNQIKGAKADAAKAEAQPKLCYGCAKPGHLRKECPVASAPVPRAQVKAVNKLAAVAVSDPKKSTTANAMAHYDASHPAFPQAGVKWAKFLHKGVQRGDVAHHRLGYRGAGRRTIDGKAVNVEMFCGSERLGAIVVGTDPTYCKVLGSFVANPLLFGELLPDLAMNFANFFIKSMTVRFVPLQSSYTAVGGLFFAYNADCESRLPEESQNGLNQVATWAKNVEETRIINKAVLKPQLVCDAVEYFVETTGDQRFSHQGCFFVFNDGGQLINLASGVSASGIAGDWFVEYEIDLYNINSTNDTASCMVGYGEQTQATAPGGIVTMSDVTGNYLIPDPDDPNFGSVMSHFSGDDDVWQNMNYAKTGGNMLFRPGTYALTISDSVLGVHNSGAGYTATATRPKLELVYGQWDNLIIDSLASDATTKISDYHYTTASSSVVAPTYSNFAPHSNVDPQAVMQTTMFAFEIKQDTLLKFTAALWVPSGINGAGPTERDWHLTVMRFGGIMQEDRPTPNLATLRAKQWNALRLQAISEADSPADVAELRVAVASVMSTAHDPIMRDMLVACFSLPGADEAAKRCADLSGATATMFGPTAASAIAWLVQHVGPIVAKKLLEMGKKRLDAWLKKHAK